MPMLMLMPTLTPTLMPTPTPTPTLLLTPMPIPTPTIMIIDGLYVFWTGKADGDFHQINVSSRKMQIFRHAKCKFNSIISRHSECKFNLGHLRQKPQEGVRSTLFFFLRLNLSLEPKSKPKFEFDFKSPI